MRCENILALHALFTSCSCFSTSAQLSCPHLVFLVVSEVNVLVRANVSPRSWLWRFCYVPVQCLAVFTLTGGKSSWAGPWCLWWLPCDLDPCPEKLSYWAMSLITTSMDNLQRAEVVCYSGNMLLRVFQATFKFWPKCTNNTFKSCGLWGCSLLCYKANDL